MLRHDLLTFAQQLRDISFRQKNEDAKNLVADERRGKNMENEHVVVCEFCEVFAVGF